MEMKYLFCLSVCACFSYVSMSNLVCYFTFMYTKNWKFSPQYINPKLCTHLIYYFAKLSGNNIIPFFPFETGIYLSLLNNGFSYRCILTIKM